MSPPLNLLPCDQRTNPQTTAGLFRMGRAELSDVVPTLARCSRRSPAMFSHCAKPKNNTRFRENITRAPCQELPAIDGCFISWTRRRKRPPFFTLPCAIPERAQRDRPWKWNRIAELGNGFNERPLSQAFCEELGRRWNASRGWSHAASCSAGRSVSAASQRLWVYVVLGLCEELTKRWQWKARATLQSAGVNGEERRALPELKVLSCYSFNKIVNLYFLLFFKITIVFKVLVVAKYPKLSFGFSL